MQIPLVSKWLVNYTMNPLCSTVVTVFVYSSFAFFPYSRSELNSFGLTGCAQGSEVPGSFIIPEECSSYGEVIAMD